MGRKKKEVAESVILRTVVHHFNTYNNRYFKGQLEQPSFIIKNLETKWGTWDYTNREITLNRRLFTKFSNWYEFKKTLKHEMAHQYVDCVLGAKGEVDPHGKLFQQIAQEEEFEEILKDEASVSTQGKDSIVAKIEKLLSLAQSDNQSEAENAMKFANHLMRKWNVSLVVEDKERNFTEKVITEPTKRRNASMFALSRLMKKHFFVNIIWVWEHNPMTGKSGWCLEIVGTETNVDIASYSAEFILRVAEQEFKKAKKNGQYVQKVSFINGVINGFMSKLEDQKAEDALKATKDGCTDLISVSDPKLNEYYHKKHPNIRQTNYGISGGRGAGYGSGTNVGRNLTIARGVGSNGSRGRLLNA
jgi:predicted SprT family Zn-dependent metalloprotease